MVSSEGKAINFDELEKELQGVIDSETLYWQQNDAKFRAVEQGVPSYEHFRQMVMAAHLKPLEKQDRIQERPKSIWNTFANRRKVTTTNLTSSDVANMNTNRLNDNFKVPTTSQDFTQQWRKCYVADADRFSFLCRIGHEQIRSLLCRNELGFGLLGEVIRALLCHTHDDERRTEHVVFVVRLLETLTDAKRFGLTLQFQSASEKSDCRALFDRLRRELRDEQQDMAEHGVTEWTLQELAKKYDVTL